MRERLPWFLEALPSEDCAKGGAGAYGDALQRSSKESSGIKASMHHSSSSYFATYADRACSCVRHSYRMWGRTQHLASFLEEILTLRVLRCTSIPESSRCRRTHLAQVVTAP